MIDVRLLRSDPEGVRASLARRGAPLLLQQIDEATAFDAGLRDISAERDSLRSSINELSKQVAGLRRDGQDAEAEQAMATSRSLGDTERVLQAEFDRVNAQLRDALLSIPNFPHVDAPDGAGDHDNPVIKGPIGLASNFPDHQRVPHWDTATELGILDNERATKISGAMFTMQRGLGATLSRALCQFALDQNAEAFEEIRPPSLVTTATLTATGHLPKFADEAYAIERDDLWTIPTAEVPLTSLHAGEILDEAVLPVRLMAYTPCYRREAGAAGRDTRGMLRSHEFDKVEILAISTPEQAPTLLQELVARAESLMVQLELPYRIIEICTGDMGASHHRSFDIEVYAPGCDAWLEVSSVSWFTDYQARRADIRFKRTGQKGTEIAHTLNGSALAVPRVWAAIMENHRQADGSVRIPDVLRVRTCVAQPRFVHASSLMSIRDRRIQYETAGLDIDDLHPDPIEQFNRWYTQAEEAKVAEPNAMTVSTVGLDGMPDSRIVLAREVEQSGFVFYTNYSSAKSKQLNENPSASAVFAWLDLHRQVRLRGKVHATSPQQSDAYFASRPRESQIGAWASAQSEKLLSRADLEARVRELTQTYSGQEIPRPAFWGGWCIVPMSMEFWQGRPSRLHDRFSYVNEAGIWSIARLSP